MNDQICYSTGSDLLDLVVGGGQRFGYPGGKIINIVGDKSSGKTFLACEIIASSYKKYGKNLKWAYDDAESGFTFDTKKLYGLQIINDEDRIKSKTVEDFYCNYRKFLESLKKNEFGIYIMDSLDGLSTQDNQERSDKRYNAFKNGKKMDKGTFGLHAPKFLSQEFFKNVTDQTEQTNSLLVIISQTRDKIDSMFKEQTRSGGRALDFYAHTVLWLSTYIKIKRKDRDVGVIVKAKTKKSKTPRPFRECNFSLLFDYGLDNIGSNLDFLFDLRGDNGRLNSNADNIFWNKKNDLNELDIIEVTPKALVEFIKENGFEKEYKEAKKEGLSSGKASLQEWIKTKLELIDKFENKFGLSMNRDDMIKWIEDNDKESELTERVREKWESIEVECKTNRKLRY